MKPMQRMNSVMIQRCSVYSTQVMRMMMRSVVVVMGVVSCSVMVCCCCCGCRGGCWEMGELVVVEGSHVVWVVWV